MADGSNQLTEDQRRKIAEWISQKRNNRAIVCPICETDKWSIADHVVTPTVLDAQAGGFNLGGVAYPQAMLVCNNCGHTHYFNVARLGIPPKQEAGK